MDELKKLLEKFSKAFDKNFSEENALDTVKSMLLERDRKINELETGKNALETRVKELEPLVAKAKELEPLAADGKAYRDSLIADYVSSKAKLGEVAETPEAQDKVKAVAQLYPVDFLRDEVKNLKKRVEEKFPATGQTKGDDRQDKSGQGQKVNKLIPK